MPLLLNHQGAPLSSPRRINDIVSCLAARAGIIGKKVTPHTLRHTFATTLVEKVGLSLPMVQQLLGHSRIDETIRYVHPDQLRLREGVEQLGQLYASAEEQIISEWMNDGLCSG
ncbi:MAG: tyrosine-type recombinase/integrase [Thermoflexales bacterium]|nr:tyrosine-type recombinase/integrase [Thermoflexales bacterium]